ncbi:MAG: nucleotidyltransferase domain-containing protein [Gammaproteobacteria bacterium]
MVLSTLRDYRADIFLFGSRATGGAGRYSDIDVGILPRESLPVGLLAELGEALEESQIIYPTLFSALPKKFHHGDKRCCRTSGVFSAVVS